MKGPRASTPDQYVGSLAGWQRETVGGLRSAVRGAADFEETIMWGHLVYMYNGPALLIRAEEERVLFGFWRGQRLREIDPRLEPGGKYEMATIELREGDSLADVVVDRLAREAHALNRELGDPRDAAKSAARAPARDRTGVRGER